MNNIIGRIAKKDFGRQAHENEHTEVGKLVQELKVDRGRRAQLRLLMELLPSGCTSEVNRTAANLLHVASSDRTKTLGEQLEDVQTQIAIANTMLQVKRAKLKRSKRRQICRELRILELAQRDAEMHQLSRRLCKQNIGPKNRTYGRCPGRKLGKQTWEDFMKGPGDQGGCSAVVIDFEVERKKVMGEV